MLPLSLAIVWASMIKSQARRIRKLKEKADQKRWKGIDGD